MELEFTTLFDHFDIEDPFLKSLSNMTKGETKEFGDITITLNSIGLFEIETEDAHECLGEDPSLVAQWVSQYEYKKSKYELTRRNRD